VTCPHRLIKLPESTQRKQAIPNKGSLFYSHCDWDTLYILYRVSQCLLFLVDSFHRLSGPKIRSKSCVIRLPLEFHFASWCDHYCATRRDSYSTFRFRTTKVMHIKPICCLGQNARHSKNLKFPIWKKPIMLNCGNKMALAGWFGSLLVYNHNNNSNNSEHPSDIRNSSGVEKFQRWL
jgi:hypothetical protein